MNWNQKLVLNFHILEHFHISNLNNAQFKIFQIHPNLFRIGLGQLGGQGSSSVYNYPQMLLFISLKVEGEI